MGWTMVDGRVGPLLLLLLLLPLLLHDARVATQSPLPAIRVAFSEGSAVGTRKLLELPSTLALDTRMAWSLEPSEVFRLQTTSTAGNGSSSFLHLETQQPLDRESRAFYKLQLVSSKMSLEVIVDVLDINDNPPMFTSEAYSVSVARSASPGRPLIRVEARDRDTGRNARLKYSVSEPFEDYFLIDGQTGQLSIRSLQCRGDECPPCLRSRGQCHVLVHVSDGGQPTQSSYTVVTVDLVAANDHAPTLAVRNLPDPSLNVSLVRMEESEAPLAAITVTDVDSGPNGQTDVFILDEENERNGEVFELERLGSSLYLLRLRERSRVDRDHYNVTLRARDAGEPPRHSETVVVVEVHQDSRATMPSFDRSLYNAKISEDVPKGSRVIEVRLDNLIEINSDHLHFAISEGNELGWFHIHSRSGLIITKDVIDSRQARSVDLEVRVSNGRQRSNETRVHIDIVDVNNHVPQLLFHGNKVKEDDDKVVVLVSEDASLGSVLGAVRASDDDFGLNAMVDIEMVENEYFVLDVPSGNVVLAKALDFENVSHLEIVLRAKDQGTPSLHSESLVIDVEIIDVDDNDPIFYPSEIIVVVDDDHHDDEAGLAIVHAWDADTDPLYRAVKYSWASSSIAWLTLNETTGTISSGRRSELRRRLPLQRHIVATSVNRASVSAHLIVHMVDKEHFRASQRIFEMHVSENDSDKDRTNRRRQVGQLEDLLPLHDAADATNLHFNIVDGDFSNAFEIDQSARLFHTGLLDREQKGLYNLTVWLMDEQKDIKDVFFIVVVIDDINDNSPVFVDAIDEINVDVNTATHASIFRAKVRDEDSRPNRVLSFSMRDSSKLFSIENNSGIVSLASNLHHVSVGQVFEVQLEVSDGKFQSSHNLLIRASSSLNSHTPNFPFDNYELSVSESAPLNRPVAAISAVDGDNDDIVFSLINDDEDNVFDIFPDGQLYLKRALDREQIDVHSLVVVADDGRGRSSSVSVVVYVMDENDNAPRFSSSSYVFSIMENVDSSEPIGRLVASDEDLGLNSELDYVVLTRGNEVVDDVVVVDRTSGLVFVTQALDREKLFQETASDVIDFEVEVRDRGNLYDKASMSIVVIDANDNKPIFSQSLYETSISESSEIGQHVITVSAADADSDDHLLFSLDSHFFALDETNPGLIVLKKALDREKLGNNITLEVLAMDKVSHTASAKVVVLIENENEYAPQFDKQDLELEVAENLDVGSVLYVFEAVDLDDDSVVEYELVDLLDRRLLQLDGRTGVLRLNNELDHEQVQSIEFGIRASDSDKLNSVLDVRLIVKDINDNAPSFKTENLRLSVREDLPVGSFVHRVHAVDEDEGLNGTLVYTLESEHSFFRIDASSGDIYTTNTLDRETSVQHSFTVLATDQCEDARMRLEGSQRIEVSVDDVNDHTPVMLNIEHAFISKSAVKNDVILGLVARDDDQGLNGRVDFSVTNGRGIVEVQDDNLVLVTNFDDLHHDFSLNVVARDAAVQSARRSTSTTVDVIVERDGQGPPFTEQKYNFVVKENSKSNTLVGQVSLSNSNDNNYDDDVKFYVVGTRSSLGDDARLLALDERTGEVFVDGNLDREQIGDVVTLDILAVNERFSSKCTLAVAILDENDSSPVFDIDSLDSIVLSENFVPAQTVGRVFALDEDKESNLVYKLDSTTENFLEIDSRSGELTLTRSIDREELSSLEVVVIVSDGLHVVNVSRFIDIMDVNDHPPLMSKEVYSFDVYENSEISTIVGTVEAEDLDASSEFNTVSYSLISEWGSDLFAMESDTGVIRIISDRLDFEENELFVLIASAADNGNPPLTSTSTIYVNVVDVNDNVPLFSPAIQRGNVKEHALIDSEVFRLGVMDADTDDELSFRVENNEKFEVTSQGVVVVKGDLDREVEINHVFKVVATDKAGHSATCMVEVVVNDINDHTPKLETMVIRVKENIASNAIAARLIASDEDHGDNADLHFSMDANSNEPFTLGKLDGVLKIVGSLDREQTASYNLTVVVTDNGNPSRESVNNVTIIVEDINDNRPVFHLSYYTANVYENASVGWSLLAVSALDLDSSSSLLFSIASGDPDNDLWMEPHTGMIRTIKRLDFERRRLYRLTLQVTDGLFVSEAEALINVMDINDNVPIFPHSPVLINVLENYEDTNQPVYTVKALDGDQSPFNLIEYYLIDDQDEAFRLNRSTGDLFLLKSLDREINDKLELEIVAENPGYFASIGLFEVNVVDVNDNVPNFDNDQYVFEVMENLEPGEVVGRVVAKDNDQGDNARISYLLSESEAFEVEEHSGILVTKITLDREQRSQYTLTLTASDNSPYGRLSSTVSIVIHITDDNDNSPKIEYRGSSDFFVRPSIEIGSFVLGVDAWDADENENAQLRFSLSGIDRNFFTVDPHNGVVITRSSLERKKAYSIVVRVSDQGSPRRRSERRFNVFTSDDIVTPEFRIITNINNDVVRINESVELETEVMNLVSEEVDVEFGIAGGNVGSHFMVEQRSGRVIVKRSLDFETKNTFELWLKAFYANKPLFFEVKSIRIRVTDANDHVPRFNSSVVHVDVVEGQYPPFEVARIVANDPDEGDNGQLTYRLIDNDEDNKELFRVDDRSGLIFCTGELDREKRDSYTIKTAAVDGGSQSATATIYVRVLDVNDNAPLFTRLHSANVSESASPGEMLLQLSTNDLDTAVNANVSFSLLGEEVDNAHLVSTSMFELDSRTGELSVKHKLDRELRDEYTLRVEASDGAWKLDTVVTINVLDENDNAPMFDQVFYSFRINLHDISKDNKRVVGRVHALDRDAVGVNSEVVYSLKHLAKFFRVEETNGNILINSESKSDIPVTLGNVNHTNAGAFVLTVVASDKGIPSRSSFCVVHIDVVDDALDSNNPIVVKELFPLPTFISSQTVLLDPSVLLRMSSSSHLFLSRPHFHIVNEEAREVVTMKEDKVYVLPNVKLEVGKKINLVIGVSEGRQKRSMDSMSTLETLLNFSLSLEVTGPNLHSPIFESTSHRVIIKETEPVNNTIVVLKASDEDEGLNGEIRYNMVNNLANKFIVDPMEGRIVVSSPLDFEIRKEHRLLIEARDKAFRSKSTTATVIVVLQDVDDNKPEFSSSEIHMSVKENEPIGTMVGMLEAVDSDSEQYSIIEYELQSSSISSNFALNPTTGQLVTTRVFDAERDTEGFELKVRARNPFSSLYSETSVHVMIGGQNEFRPRFGQPVFQFVVSERQQFGSVIGAVKAMDKDVGEDGQVFYYLMGSSKHFRVDKKSGQIIVINELDREQQSRHVLTVLAKNKGSVRELKDVDETQCVIQVLDGNDPPMFSQSVYMVNVAEDVALGHHVLTVKAHDKDLRPRNSLFTYSIEPSLASDHFSVGANDGRIVVAKKLDREDVALINLTVIAVDNGDPPAIGRTSVIVELIDVNDSGPELECCTELSVKENAVKNTLVTILKATDPDLPIHGQRFHFTLIPSEHAHLFELNEQTGELRTNEVLDAESNPEVRLEVRVDDGSDQSSVFEVEVKIEDENDNESRPREVVVIVKTFEGTFNGGLLAHVRPDDPDVDDVYHCRLIEGPKNIFEVREDCSIRAGKLKDPRVYQLTVMAGDGVHNEVEVRLKINFVRFGRSAIDNAVAVRFINVDAQNILSFFQTLTPNDRNLLLQLLSFHSVSSSSASSSSSFDAFVSLQEDSSVLSREQAIQFLIELFDSPVTQHEQFSISDMIIDYTPCLEKPCGLNGECFSSINIDTHTYNRPFDFADTVFKSPLLRHSVKCRCKAGFSGSKCDIQTHPCTPNPCSNSGQCQVGEDGEAVCSCPQGFTGQTCQFNLDTACRAQPCRNQGTCQPAPSDSQGFLCLCRPGFHGDRCELSLDACADAPCLNGGTCVSLTPTYRCECADNFYGKHCQLSTLGFEELSHVAFNALDANTNDIEIVFSTTKSDALLVYNYGSVIGGRSDFLAVELVSGQPRMSWGASRTAVARLGLDRRVDTGRWHKLTVTRNHKVGTMSLEDCAEAGELCKICTPDNPECFKKTEGQAGTLSLSSHPLYFGGLPDLQPWLERRQQVSSTDFVGCVKSLVINGYVQDFKRDAINSSGVADTCNQRVGGACSRGDECRHPDDCVPLWSAHKCRCSSIIANDCSSSLTPFSLSGAEHLVFRPTEKWRRLKVAKEKWQSDSKYPDHLSSIRLAFRTLAPMATLLTSLTMSEESSQLGLKEGMLVYRASTKASKLVMRQSDMFLADGHWHHFVMERDKELSVIKISVDDIVVIDDIEASLTHDFLSPLIHSIIIGSQHDRRESEESTATFRGCFANFSINNVVQEMDKETNYFQLVSNPRQVHLGCDVNVLQSARPRSALGLGVGLVVAFFLFLVCAISASFLFFKVKRKLNKRVGHAPNMNNNENNNADVRQPKHEYMFEQFGRPAAPNPAMAVTARMNNVETNVSSATPPRPPPNTRPDLLATSEASAALFASASTPTPAAAAAAASSAEHYDLENASSIAPSDIDVVYHYKGFRHHTNRSRGMHHTTPLARLSPSSELSHPRIVNLGELSNSRGKQRLIESPSTVGESRGTPLSHVSSARSRRARHRHRGQPTTTLTSENVARFNKSQGGQKTHKSALIDTVNMVNNGSEVVTNSTPVMDLHPRLHSRSSSSSSSSMKDDDGDDDSFTCSEFEGDNEEGSSAVGPMATAALVSGRLRVSEERTSSTEPLLLGNEGPQVWEKLLNWVPDYHAFAGVFSDIAELSSNETDRPTPIGNNRTEKNEAKDIEQFI